MNKSKSQKADPTQVKMFLADAHKKAAAARKSLHIDAETAYQIAYEAMLKAFSSNRTGDWQIWRRELSSGKEVQITQHGGLAGFESFDAKTLYYSQIDRP